MDLVESRVSYECSEQIAEVYTSIGTQADLITVLARQIKK
jgi:hypothetical protein